ncbi:hypothetical protein [Acetatifactor muris]|uniref:hypothetical protein n=1 Tax=Acetatifactor muris TaxID=879566 RepID=UPI0023F2C11A|nr:hypothetical protein [Acetatifactor muris]
MAEKTVTKFGEKSWNPQEAYERVNHMINNDWPDWKKKAYNETFATSKHAEKLLINNR